MEKYLSMLQSKKSSIRYEACEKLRLSENLPKEALRALQAATNDIDPLVADAARRALLLHSGPAISDQSSLDDNYNSMDGTIEASKTYEQEQPSTPWEKVKPYVYAFLGGLVVHLSLICCGIIRGTPIEDLLDLAYILYIFPPLIVVALLGGFIYEKTNRLLPSPVIGFFLGIIFFILSIIYMASLGF